VYTKYLTIILLFITTTLPAQQLPECWYRSQAAIDKGEYSIALQWIDSCIVQKERNYLYWLKKGEILYSQKEYQSALESLLKADKLKQGSSSYFLAKTYCVIGDTASCFVWLKTYLGISDKLSEGAVKLEPAFGKISTSKHWQKIWNSEWYSAYEKLVSDADYSISEQNWEEALDLINPRLKGNKPRPQLLALRAEAYFGLGSFRNAIDDYTIAIKKSKKNHQYLTNRAKAYFSLERYSAAINDLTKAIDLSGGKPHYFLRRAEAYYKNKEYNKAFDDISYYLSFYPSNTDASFLAAEIAIENGLYVDALFSLGKLIKTNPNEAKYFYYRAIAYIKTGNFSVAETDLNVAIAKNYKLSDSYFQRGIARLNLGDKDNACLDIDLSAKNGNFNAQELFYNKCRKPLQQQKW
jgi:tetratricopeptide (TPR) repeat protein